MPVSDLSHVPVVMSEVMRLNPGRVYDVGVGFGKYGVLCREVLDATYGRCRPNDWGVVINGVEGFVKYRNPCWELYDDVLHGVDIASIYDTIIGYDLVLFMDVMEHFPKEVGQTILQTLVQNNKQVIVSVPIGDCPQGAVFGNEYEVHRASYQPKDFNMYNGIVLHRGTCFVMSIKGGH